MNVAQYVIEQRGDQWCLLTGDGSRVLGCHDSKGDAEAQERAIQTAKHSQAYEIRAVEIFREGTWNGDQYTIEHLDAMVLAANEVGFTPPLKAGHSKDDSAPALGWIENLKRVGTSLYADLVALPKSVYDLIRSRAYDAVSAEIYFNLDRGGKKYPRVLKALALLGAEPPAVDLQPLRAFLSMAPTPVAQFSSYTTTLAESPMEKTEEKAHAEVMDPDADGNCQPGYTKGDDGKCHMKAADMAATTTAPAPLTQTPPPTKGTVTMAEATVDTPVKDGEIVVKLSEITRLRQQAQQISRIAPLEQELERERAAAVEREEQQRERQIIRKVNEVKIPALRVFMRVFAEWGLKVVPEVRTYALQDPKMKHTPEEILDAFIAFSNKQADVLFQTLSVDTKPVDQNEPDQISDKIDYRINEYCRTNKLDKKKDYKAAFHAVLNADPDLKAAYTRA